MADKRSSTAQNARNTEKKRRNPILSFMGMLASVSFAVYCLVSIISVQASIADKRSELKELNEKAKLLEAENDEYTRLLNMMEGENMDEYMERVAIEKCGYAYPGERRFYDNSRN